MSAVNAAVLALVGVAVVVALIVPVWLMTPVALVCLFVGGALIEWWFLDD